MLSGTLHVLLLTIQKGCYIFTPDELENVSQRPWKRRRTECAKAPDDHGAELPFAPLLKGLERIECTRIRSEIFEMSWRPKEALLKVHRSS